MTEELIVLIIFFMLNIIFSIKPKIPLLNILFGLFLTVFTLYMYETLPFGNLLMVFMLSLSVICVSSGVISMMKNRR